MKAITGGGEWTTPMITACMSRCWKVEVCRKNKIQNTTGKGDDQSAISSKWSTSSTKQHKLIFVSYAPIRPLALGRQTITAMESGTTATTMHAMLQRVFSGKINTQRVRCDSGRMHATRWFLPWIRRLLLRISRGAAQQQEERVYFPLFLCRKCVVHPHSMP